MKDPLSLILIISKGFRDIIDDITSTLKLIIWVKLEKFWLISYLANLDLSAVIELLFPSDKVLHTPPPQYRGTSDDLLSSSARTRPDKKTLPLESRRAASSSSFSIGDQPIFHSISI